MGPALQEALPRYAQPGSDDASLLRHVTLYRRLVLGTTAAGSPERAALHAVMPAFSPELSVAEVVERLCARLPHAFKCERASALLVLRRPPADSGLPLAEEEELSGMRAEAEERQRRLAIAKSARDIL